MTPVTLYAVPFSLYSAKARSYLLKNHVPFTEVSQGTPHYAEKILPKIGRMIIPVLELSDGTIIQDGAAIIDHFETQGNMPCRALPATPRHKVVSQIFSLFGGEGLLRPAMHYRWNFPDTNQPFLSDQFATFILPLMEGDARTELTNKVMGRMQTAARGFGANPDTAPVIEAAYEEFLAELEAHFRAHPYLLGGRPTLGDYGLIAPLYPHLGRDPYPAQMMKDKARAVYCWTERMNRPDAAMPDFPLYGEQLCADDAIPDTLMTLLKRVAADYLPEVKAMVGFTNQWLVENPVNDGDVVGGEKQIRAIGECSFEWRGTMISCWVMPYRIWLLQRIQDCYDALPDKTAVDALLAETGLSALVTARANRRVERRDNREVWGQAV